ncbi:hypothetical protein GCK32_002693, partial [Trichostrongylus colubriformis]
RRSSFRFEAAQREYAQLDEDALLVKLCDIRMKLSLAEGRGKRIEEECRRIRLENQKIIEDQSSQRLIIDREGIDRNAYERRAADLLVECESLLESFRPSTARRYTFDDIESDRRLFRSAIDSAMIDIRRQYENNRLLEALIADFEEAKAADLMSAESQVREDQVQLKNMMDQYDSITSGSPVPQTYTIASLRQEILRYRELLYGIGSGILSDGPTAAGALSIVHHRASSRERPCFITFLKVAADGSYITLENTSLDSDQDLGEWTLRSTSSTLKLVSYTFPRDFILTPQNTVQIYARGRGVHNPPHSLVCESDTTFATGDDLSVFLYDNNGQERAHLSQRSFFRSFSSF